MNTFKKRMANTNVTSIYPSILNSADYIEEFKEEKHGYAIKYVPNLGDSKIKLCFGKIEFEQQNFFGLDVEITNVKYNQSITYDLNTKTFEGLNILDEVCQFITKENHKDVIEFIMEVMKNENVWVYSLFTKETSDLKYIHSYDVSNQIVNLLKHIDKLGLFEKVAKVNGNKFIFENLKDKNFNLNQSKKFKNIVGVSIEGTTYLKKKKIEEMLPQFQTIFASNGSEDGKDLANDGKEFVDYLTACDKIFKPSKYELTSFIKSFAEIIDYGYRTRNVLNHLVRENYFFENLGLPTNLSLELRDTIIMAQTNGLPIDKLPKNITKYHAILAANCDITKNPRTEEFKEATSMYNRLEAESDNYIVRVPRDEKDLLEEGNLLHHCVASYRDKIIDDKAIVMFLRKKDDPDSPYVTIELDEDLNFLQIKEIYDADVTDKDVLSYLTKWINSKRYLIDGGKSIFKKPENKMTKKAQKEAAAAEQASL